MSALAAPILTGTVASAISDEAVLRPNRLAWVTQHFLILRNTERQTHTIVPLVHLTGIEIHKTPYSGLLALAAGVFVISAAAFTSKQGDGAALPSALLGVFLLISYFASRRAIINFKLDTGVVESTSGTVGDAISVVRLIEQARSSALSGENVSAVTPALDSGSAVKQSKTTAQPAFQATGLV